MVITIDMILQCRSKRDGVIVADSDDRPIVRSAIHYDGPDPLYDEPREQVVVLRADDLSAANSGDTDQDIAVDLSQRWQDMADEARWRVMACSEFSVGVIITSGDLILLIQRAEGPKAGTWACPAGHWEPGETIEQAAIREVLEEVTLRLPVGDLGEPILEDRFADQCRYGVSYHRWAVYEVRCPLDQAPVRDQTETLDMRWVPHAELAGLDLEPVWRRIFTEMGHLR
jgi:8-oxo-dGTP diphosphatase